MIKLASLCNESAESGIRLTNVVTGENPAVNVKYGTNSGAEKKMATPTPAQAINKNASIILTSMNSNRSWPSQLSTCTLSDCYHLLGGQPGYIPREVPVSTLSLFSQIPLTSPLFRIVHGKCPYCTILLKSR
jgi:hypothetical protein